MNRTTALVMLFAILVIASVVLIMAGKGEATVLTFGGIILAIVNEVRTTRETRKITAAKDEAEAKAQESFETTQVLMTEKAALEAKLAKRNTKPS